MTTHETETLLRGLAAGADAAAPAEDPWPRVERAWRRSRRRRRGAAAGALLAVAAIGTGTVIAQPWAPLTRAVAPADRSGVVDDGDPRGPLGDDPALLADVRAALGDPAARLVWGGDLGGGRIALAGTAARLTWLAEDGPGSPLRGSLSVLRDEMPLATHRWTDTDGVQHLLVVVPRGATVESSRAEITGTGRVRRTWRPVRVTDGWADLAVPDQATRGPVVVRSDAAPGTSADTLGEFVRPHDAEVAAALESDTGPGLAAGDAEDARTALMKALEPFGGRPSERDAKVIFSRSVPEEAGGGSVVVATAGLPGQGRHLVAVGSEPDGRTRWIHRTTVPAGELEGVLGWRVQPTSGDGEIVGWLTGRGGRFQVQTPDREAEGEGTRFGWLRVQPGEDVRLRGTDPDGDRVDMLLGPEALDPPGGAPDWKLPGEAS